MGKLRFLFALWMAKLSVPALKITRHNGTDFPGTLALKLCPDFLKYVGRPKTIIAVTGTNGKPPSAISWRTPWKRRVTGSSSTGPVPTWPAASPPPC